ncbi:hypothetical protein VISP3789_04804 [Vibrio splendidus ATCC 33789]|nr:hypothetical protein VISP3789_04804 [Vibrio splendidus ATCC 33789]
MPLGEPQGWMFDALDGISITLSLPPSLANSKTPRKAEFTATYRGKFSPISLELLMVIVLLELR